MKTLITPELAKELLENNKINRNVIEANVVFLIKEIENDRFVYNGESIIVSNNGTLMDGQHRLLAIIQANKSVYINLVTGVEESAMATIDTGIVRTAGAVFSLNNIKNSTNMASFIKRIMEKMGTERRTLSKRSVKISNQELLDFYYSKSELFDSMFSFSNSLYMSNVKFSTPAYLSTFLYLFSLEDKRAKNFIRELINGNAETESNAPLKLRDKLINNRISNVKMSETRMKDVVIYSWRRYILGKDMNVVPKNLKISFIKGSVYELKSKLSSEDFE